MIICLTGMPCSGKSIFSKCAKKYGFDVIEMGDIVRRWVRKYKLNVNQENVRAIAVSEREKYGKSIWATRTLQYIRNKNTVIDGIRSLEEVNIFQSNLSDIIIVSVHAQQKIRLKRILKRKRKDDVMNINMFYLRDKQELRFGVGNVIAMSDIILVNNSTIEKFENDARVIIERLVNRKNER